jgi:hypothetical protein
VLGEPAQATAPRRVAMAGGLQVHERATPGGVAVREFVGADGRVFAVAWHGRLKPDLHALLGAYASDYEAAARETMQRRPGLRRNVQLQRGDLVVQASGYLNSFSGRAYLASRLPAGVGVDALR